MIVKLKISNDEKSSANSFGPLLYSSVRTESEPGEYALPYGKQYETAPIFSLWNNSIESIFSLGAIGVVNGLGKADAHEVFCGDLKLTLYSSLTQAGC
jgi:hypothetical protein